MTQPLGRSTRTSTIIKAPREAVYQAFLDPDAVATWLAPDNMNGQVEIYEPYAGGRFRMSLTYLDQSDAAQGKTSADTDTFEARFIELLPNTRIVQTVVFESDQPDFAGEMKITWSLADVAGGTEVTVLFENIPPGIALEDNETGSRQSLQKLVVFVQQRANDQGDLNAR